MRRACAALVGLGFLGCAATQGTPPAEAYARALETGQLAQAYALTTPSFQSQVSEAQFRLRFSDAGARAARAAAVREGMAALALAAPELAGTDAVEAPRAVVLRFAAAVQSGDFDEAWRCLSAALRRRYTVEALARDFQAEPDATARLRHAAVAVEGIPVKTSAGLSFPLPGGGAVVLVQEPGGWRLEALE